MADLDALSFLSKYPIDKIVQHGTMTLIHPGAMSSTYGTTTNEPNYRNVTVSQTNNYGRKGYIRGRYSIDGGTTWNGMDQEIVFDATLNIYFMGTFNSTTAYPGTAIKLVIGSSDSLVYASARGERRTSPARADVDSSFNWTYSGWSPISTTVIIEYWMFERD